MSREDSDDSAFYCEMCDGKFCGLDELNSHISEIHPEPDTKKELLSNASNTAVKPISRPARDSAYYCASCSFKTWSISSLTQHRKEIHNA